jgi:uncharacterized protein YbbC (DUF1343 family)
MNFINKMAFLSRSRSLTLSVLVSFTLMFTAGDCGAVIVLNPAKPLIKTGIEVLKSSKFKQLEGKRIALVTNPTGVDDNLVSTIDLLFAAKNVKLVALFAPEHGVRGDVYAGGAVENTVDSATGVPVYSIYGKNLKPSPDLLRGVDAIVYDIQDNGCRSYTFISTLGKIMEAAAENDKEVIVLDRPNPLGGEKVEGSLVEDGYISFVSQFKIPYLYGLTVGELAQLINGENLVGKQCRLTVIKMNGWRRSMTYDDTRLPWILPSPHVPQAITSFFYPASGILGELGYLSIGVGYTLPFQIFAAPWIDANRFSAALNSLNLPGVMFRPICVKPYYSVFSGQNIQGVQFFITDYKKAALSEIQFYVMQVIAELYPDRAVFAKANESRFRMFDLVCGSNYIRETFSQTNKASSILNFWNKDVKSFKELSKGYYLY